MRYLNLWTDRKVLFLSLHLILVAVTFSGWLTGNKPIVCKYNGHWYFPVYQFEKNKSSNLTADLQNIGQMNYHKLNYDFVIWPLFDLDPAKLNAADAWLRPGMVGNQGTFYFLGTYELGRDLFSACIHGLSKSLWIAFLTILIAAGMGISVGSLAVYQSQRIQRISIWSGLMGGGACLILFFIIFLFVETRSLDSVHFILFAIFIFLISMAIWFYEKKPLRSFSLDRIILAYVEIMKSIPALLFLLIMVQIFIKPGTIALSLIIAFLYVPVILKYSRSFTYKFVSEPFLDALAVSGASPMRIYLKHILPKIVVDMMPVLAFGLANIILLESSLSFLGLGLPVEAISLGNIMNSARGNPAAWWAVLIPGGILFWLVYTMNSLGEWLSKRQDVNWIQDVSPNA